MMTALLWIASNWKTVIAAGLAAVTSFFAGSAIGQAKGYVNGRHAQQEIQAVKDAAVTTEIKRNVEDAFDDDMSASDVDRILRELAGTDADPAN